MSEGGGKAGSCFDGAGRESGGRWLGAGTAGCGRKTCMPVKTALAMATGSPKIADTFARTSMSDARGGGGDA